MKKKIKSCPDTEILLAYSEGILKDELMETVNEHLMDCDVCLKEVFMIKRTLKTVEMQDAPVPEILKERALRITRCESTMRKTLKHLSEFIISLTDKGFTYVSNLSLPDNAVFKIYPKSLPIGEFREQTENITEKIILEETLKEIKIVIILFHGEGPFVHIKVLITKNGHLIANKRISLFQDESLLSSKLTSHNGEVEFSGLSYGLYSILIPSEDIELRFRIKPDNEGYEHDG